MTDLREKVEGLRGYPVYADSTWSGECRADPIGAWIPAAAVLALIPEGAVLVTEETLTAAIIATHWYAPNDMERPSLSSPTSGRRRGDPPTPTGIL